MAGMSEYWNVRVVAGMSEYWNVRVVAGMSEYWNVRVLECQSSGMLEYYAVKLCTPQ